MVHQVVHIAAKYFVRTEAQHARPDLIDEDAATLQVDAVYSFTGRFQQ
jgi:hypothetical protein